jgi:hypothetical protein
VNVLERSALCAVVLLPLALAPRVGRHLEQEGRTWYQWGRDAQHSGRMLVVGQPLEAVRSDVVIDPNADDMVAQYGDLYAHYQVPLVEGRSVYSEVKGGAFTGLRTWETQTWGIERLDWVGGQLATTWTYWSDWKPVPNFRKGGSPYGAGPSWEPVFHGALAGSSVWVPGAGGTVLKLRKQDGAVEARVNPLGSTIDPTAYTVGPVTVAGGAVVFDVIRLDGAQPWAHDVVDSWLVRVAADGQVFKVSYRTLVAGAPAGLGQCESSFTLPPPWPPSPNAVAPTLPCGSQRAALNLAPAVGSDGAIYTVSRAHFNGRYGYLIALNDNLTLRWAATLRGRLDDGCNASLPPNGTPGGCSVGAATGVDPATNASPAGIVHDDSTSSPTVAPDGSVLYGAFTRYNFDQGHMMRFSGAGAFLGAYPFGWDTTAAIYPHQGTYSILFKENHYSVGSYCGTEAVCPSDRSTAYPDDPEAYLVTQLGPALAREWTFVSTNTESCERAGDGSLTCVADHPHGFEFCVNHIAVDGDGVVYANGEDGVLYAISQGGGLKQSLFLDSALGAAYTPLSLGPDGTIFTQNFGHLIAVGRQP